MAERQHHPDCPVNYWTDKPERCRCVFMAMIDKRATPPAAEGADVPVVLNDLRALLDAATPVGEWRAVEGDLEGGTLNDYIATLLQNRQNDGTTTGRLFLTLAPNDIDPELGAEVVPAMCGDGPRAEANANLIAAAVNALPGLLARLAAAEREAAERGLDLADTYRRAGDEYLRRAEAAEAERDDLRREVAEKDERLAKAVGATGLAQIVAKAIDDEQAYSKHEHSRRIGHKARQSIGALAAERIVAHIEPLVTSLSREAERTAKVEATLRLLCPDHITPEGARRLRAALSPTTPTTDESEQP